MIAVTKAEKDAKMRERNMAEHEANVLCERKNNKERKWK